MQQALIVDHRTDRLNRSLVSWINAGFTATGSASLVVAETCLDRVKVDILVVERETLGDALGDMLGMAEERNPDVVSLLRTDDLATDLADLPQHFPSLHGILCQEVAPDIVTLMGLASRAPQQIALSPTPVLPAMPDEIMARYVQAPVFRSAAPMARAS